MPSPDLCEANHLPPSFSFISENPIVAKVQYWMKITFVFILILFIDSVNRVYRVQVELAAATENTGASAYVLCNEIPTPSPSMHRTKMGHRC